jgi:hypothetical protein
MKQKMETPKPSQIHFAQHGFMHKPFYPTTLAKKFQRRNSHGAAVFQRLVSPACFTLLHIGTYKKRLSEFVLV